MFFSFSKRKITILGVLSLFIVGSAFATVGVGDRINAGEATSLYARRAKESLAYWWSNDFARGNLASAIRSKDATDAEARSLPILTYHGLPSESAESDPFSSEAFSEHMKSLSNAGWSSITLSQFEDFIRGRASLPDKSFLLTFDDGRKDTFYPADPVLRNLGMNAVMFAITKRSVFAEEEHSPYYLSLYELQAMEKSGRWDIQSHGRDSHDWYYISEDGAIGHFFSNLLWSADGKRNETPEEFRQRISYDLTTSKRDLETALGKKVTAFAYPFGDFGQDGANHPGAVDVVKEEVEKVYDFAFYQVRGGETELFNYPSLSAVMMKRIEPKGDWSGERLLSLLESARVRELPYTADSFGEEWRSSWGEVSKGAELSLKAPEGTAGAGAGLSGSWLWDDYAFNADTVWHAGTNIVLSARGADEDNHFGCNFGRGKVYIKSLEDGESNNLVEADYLPPRYGSMAKLGIVVDGSTVRCTVDGATVLSAPRINSRIANGGVSIEIWDAQPGIASASFDNISVVAE